jgi:hypothetical protein
MATAALEDVIQYRNEAVVLRFMETWDLPRADADDLFEQMNKWLWLTATTATIPDAPRLAITPSTKLVDEMWHTFILFTNEYVSYCDRYFGRYLHHDPTPQSEYETAINTYESDPDSYMRSLEETFARQYELVYDLLGEDTLVKWYQEYTERYTDEYMQRIWRWSFSPYDTRVRQSLRVAPTSAGAGPMSAGADPMSAGAGPMSAGADPMSAGAGDA